MSKSKIFEPLTLPSGSVLSNRIAKAALEENLAHISAGHLPSNQLFKLYSTWAQGGVGLIITGNVMIDSTAMTGPGGVVLEDDKHLEVFEQWAKEAKKNGTKVWMQINNAGRQMRVELGQKGYAPSAIPLDMGMKQISNLFVQPEEMTVQKIEDVIQRFVKTATLAERAGFDGVEVHAAHGYLISQFLSPLSNQRTDDYGGSLANRARFLLTVLRRIRAAVSSSFTVAVKLNSADFQRGGFQSSDAVQVVRWMNEEKLVDVVEVSGGSYESPAMAGGVKKGERSLAREAYFLEFAKEIVEVSDVPVMCTGGIRNAEVMDKVLSEGVDICGVGTALALNPDLPNKIRSGEEFKPTSLPEVSWSNKTFASLAQMGIVKWNLRKVSLGEKPSVAVWPSFIVVFELVSSWWKSRKYKAVMAKKSKMT